MMTLVLLLLGTALLVGVSLYARQRRELAARERSYQEAAKRQRRAAVELDCFYRNEATREAQLRARNAVRTRRTIEKHLAREVRRDAQRAARTTRQAAQEAEEYRAQQARQRLRETRSDEQAKGLAPSSAATECRKDQA